MIFLFYSRQERRYAGKYWTLCHKEGSQSTVQYPIQFDSLNDCLSYTQHYGN